MALKILFRYMQSCGYISFVHYVEVAFSLLKSLTIEWPVADGRAGPQTRPIS